MEKDLIVIGSGPGGYVAAIRAAQLGMKVSIVERESLGGVCLNWGCIPTKALLKSAEVWNNILKSEDYGFSLSSPKINFDEVIKRSRNIANEMSKGVSFLLKKNNIEIIDGFGSLKDNNTVIVQSDSSKKEYKAKKIIIATGARSRELPNIKIDHKKVIDYRDAMILKDIPKKMVIIGAGAIGCEFAYFYNSMGSEVTLVEYMDRIAPIEDSDISKALNLSFTKSGINVMPNTEVLGLSIEKRGSIQVKTVSRKEREENSINADVVLSAAGISPNIENIGLEELNILVENNRIKVDKFYKTSQENIYAIGDVICGPALAHVASAEGIICVEKIAGLNPEPIDYNNIPGCTYCKPEIASVGYTEEKAKEAGYKIKVGKFPFVASGKASAAGDKTGFVKVIFDEKYGEWLGAHMIGANVTELIAEVVAARKLETTAHEILTAIHPHPTMSEAVMEAVADAYDECIHL